MVTVLPVGTLAGAVYVVGIVVGVVEIVEGSMAVWVVGEVVGENEPQSALPQIRDQSTPALAGSFSTVAVNPGGVGVAWPVKRVVGTPAVLIWTEIGAVIVTMIVTVTPLEAVALAMILTVPDGGFPPGPAGGTLGGAVKVVATPLGV